MAKRDIAAEITQQFIDAIEGGMVDGKWQRPWNQVGGFPHNALTNKDYSGVNALLLMMHGGSTYATYKQWGDMGCQVRKGSKGHTIMVPMFSKKDVNGDQRLFGFKGATVFDMGQVEGYEAPELPEGITFHPHARIDADMVAMGVPINNGGDRAFYSPAQDSIQMPLQEQFHSSEDYYSTLAHEGAHATGHKDRLNRELNTTRFGSEAYAFEELVAELASTFLCAEYGITQGFDENHAKYLKSWLTVLKGDSKAIMTAAGMAQKARDYIINQTGAQDEEAVAA